MDSPPSPSGSRPPTSYPQPVRDILGSMAKHTASLSSTREKHVSWDLASDEEKGTSSNRVREDSASSTASASMPLLDTHAHHWRTRLPRRRPILSGVMAIASVFTFLGLTYILIIYFVPDTPVLAIPGGGEPSGLGAVPLVQSGPLIVEVSTSPSPSTRPHRMPVKLPPPVNGNVFTLEDDTTHVLVPITELTRPTPLLEPISTRLPHSLLTTFYTTGEFPSSSLVPPSPPLDFVYLWVNASSPYFQTALEDKAMTENVRVSRNTARRWRDNGELRGAMRAAATSLGSALSKIHIISGDYMFDFHGRSKTLPSQSSLDLSVDLRGWQMGQIPAWLDWRNAKEGGEVGWHFHSDVFRLPRDNDGLLAEGLKGVEWEDRESEQRWRETAMPSFDSFEIETRVGWVEGLRENFVLSNDDMFLTNSLSSTDFHHPLLGAVIRLDPTLSLYVKHVITPDLFSTPGEWGGLQYASSLVSQRFPARPRMYIHHIPKALSRSLMQEASIMFVRELTEAATRGFRESKRGLADVEMAWLVTHLKVERWREALLWSWAVARVGGESGAWEENARDETRNVLGLRRGQEGEVVVVEKRKRETLAEAAQLSQKAGWDAPMGTTYQFSSFDGHLPARPDLDLSTKCTFNLTTCLPPSFFESTTAYVAESMFKHLAFAQPQCGDCLIDALINASGPKGLSAILPTKDQIYYPSGTNHTTKEGDQEEGEEGRDKGVENEKRETTGMWKRTEPILPLTATWGEADFSLRSVVSPGQDMWAGSEARTDGGVNLRDWSIKLLSRYAYVFGSTAVTFVQIHSDRQLDNTFRTLGPDTKYAMACINDDQPDSAGKVSRDKFADWMESRWGGGEVGWERPGFQWRQSS